MACRIADAAVIANRVRLVALRPEQASGGFGLGDHRVDLVTALQGKAEVAVIARRQSARLATGHDDEYEVALTAWLGHPHDLRALARTPVDDPHAAEVSVEVDAGL